MKIIISLITIIFISGCTTAMNKPAAVNESLSDAVHVSDVAKMKVVIPVYSQKVSFNLPSRWKAAYQDAKPDRYMMEFTPKNESINDWTNLLTIQGYKNLADKISPEHYLDFLASKFRQTCQSSAVYQKLKTLDVNGHQAYSAILGCGQVPSGQASGIKQASSEVGYYLAVKGEKDFYVIHKSIRGETFHASSSPLNRHNVAEFIDGIFPVALCEKSSSPVEC